MANWVFFFGDGMAEGDPNDKMVLGGKGASLAAMSAAKLRVPPGFTISTECCRLFLEAEGRWPAGLEDQVKANLAKLEASTGRKFGDPANPLLVSVRSGAAASMPGMMDTILNCGLATWMATHQKDPIGFWKVYAQFCHMFAKTVANVSGDEFDAVEAELIKAAGHNAKEVQPAQQEKLALAYQQLYTKKSGKPFPREPWETLVECVEAVFHSWNTPRAITYRREHDIRGLAGTAVNIQSMWPSEVSGISFTANPNNLDADEMIIEAAFGLGEAVVSGDVHPDNFVIDRKTLKIKKKTIGHKVHAVAAMGDTAVRKADDASLTDEQILEVAELSMSVEKFFGKPMDIEWGLAGGKFALLQSRPIRGLEIVEDVEIGRKEEIHRLREVATTARKVWIRHNLSETLPAPTPLTWDIVGHFMSGNGGFGKMYKDFGYTPSDEVCREGFLELICGRIYADPDRAAKLFWEGMPLSYDLDAVAKDPKLMDTAPSKFDPDKADTKFLFSFPGLLRKMFKTNKQMKQLRKGVVEHFEKDVLPKFLEWVKAKRAQDLTKLSTAELVAELKHRIAYAMDDFGGESLKPGFFGGMAQGGLEGALTQVLGNQAGRQLTMVLTQGLDGDTTMEQNAWLCDCARGKVNFDDFIERYGHRAVEEMELSRPRYREDRAYVKQSMSAYLDPKVPSPGDRHHENAKKREDAQRSLPETLAQWGASSLLESITADLVDAQRMVPYREAGKHYLMMGYEIIQQAILELSKRWDLGKDIFYLNLEEIETYEARKAELADFIKQRKIRYQSARRLEMPEVIDSKELESLGLPRKYASAKQLSGDAIASGVAIGTARIVKDPTQTADLCSDYILVCHSTDPSWTALFVHARGLIVEQGGILSHGAIVARDFGIPAVVCPDATKRIPDGSSVRVDGNRGQITLLDGA